MSDEFIEYPEEKPENNSDDKKTIPEPKVKEPQPVNNDIHEIKERKSSKIGWIILILIIIFGAGYAGYYFGFRNDSSKNQETNNVQVVESEANFIIEEKEDEPAEEVNDCYELMTPDEKALSKNWETYSNSKYNYSFKYPKSWEIKHEEDDFISFMGSDEELSFQFRSDTMSALGFEGHKLDKKEKMTIACANANISYLSGDTSFDPPLDENNKLILTTFSVNDIPHLVDISYTYLGASVSADIVEAYNTILKSIKFE